VYFNPLHPNLLWGIATTALVKGRKACGCKHCNVAVLDFSCLKISVFYCWSWAVCLFFKGILTVYLLQRVVTNIILSVINLWRKCSFSCVFLISIFLCIAMSFCDPMTWIGNTLDLEVLDLWENFATSTLNSDPNSWWQDIHFSF